MMIVGNLSSSSKNNVLDTGSSFTHLFNDSSYRDCDFDGCDRLSDTADRASHCSKRGSGVAFQDVVKLIICEK